MLPAGSAREGDSGRHFFAPRQWLIPAQLTGAGEHLPDAFSPIADKPPLARDSSEHVRRAVRFALRVEASISPRQVPTIHTVPGANPGERELIIEIWPLRPSSPTPRLTSAAAGPIIEAT
jgi:hypothetical protein